MTTSPRPGDDARATATATADHLAAGHGVDDAASDVPHGIRRLPNWVLTLLAIGTLYMLIVAIGVIGDGFKSLGKDAAEGLFDFATNPFIALFVGVLATAIIQS